MTIRALVVDDEAPARRRLRDLLGRAPDVELVGECADGASAVEAILRLRPDLVFLDVQMPEMSGLDVLRQVGPDQVPAIVFVTAYDEHAVEAFDRQALDYLLKPFTEERYIESLRRVRRLLATRADADAMRARVMGLVSEASTPTRIPVRKGSRTRFVAVEDVDRIEAAGNYVRLFTGEEDHLVRGTLKSFAARLAPRGFLRIHHSHVVNLDRVVEVEPWGHGEFVVRLRGGAELVSSRTYSAALRSVLEEPLGG